MGKPECKNVPLESSSKTISRTKQKINMEIDSRKIQKGLFVCDLMFSILNDSSDDELTENENWSCEDFCEKYNL